MSLVAYSDSEDSSSEASSPPRGTANAKQGARAPGTKLPGVEDVLALAEGTPSFLKASEEQERRKQVAQREERKEAGSATAEVGREAGAGASVARSAVAAAAPARGAGDSEDAMSRATGAGVAATVASRRGLGPGERGPVKRDRPDKEKTEKMTAKDRVKRQRMKGQAGIGDDFRVWRSEQEMAMRQQYD